MIVAKGKIIGLNAFHFQYYGWGSVVVYLFLSLSLSISFSVSSFRAHSLEQRRQCSESCTHGYNSLNE